MPADEYLRICTENDSIPDVFRFLADKTNLTNRQRVDVLLVDQFQRWRRNQVIPVDQYLGRTPEIEDELKVELLIEEYGYLDQRGIAPSETEFVERYRSLPPEAWHKLCDGLEIEDPDLGSGGSASCSGSSASESASTRDKSLPKSIGRYQVVRQLGKGAFGRVFLARDPELDRSVAIKVATEKRIRMGGGADEFLREARAVAGLEHPNIVPVFDCGVSDDQGCFVVSKFVRGKELRAEIRKGFSHRESAFIIGTLARALHVAHVAGLVHRDVKPGNIIIDSKRQPHLLDFGLALSVQDSDDSKALIGTPAYMSPEQAQGAGNRVDGRSDVYSLAVIFYEMLTGHRPYKADDTDKLLRLLKTGEVRPPRQSDDTIPAELESICLKALSRQLSDRYNTAKDMADDIEDWLIQTGTGEGSIGVSSSRFGYSESASRSLSSWHSLRSQSGKTKSFLANRGFVFAAILLVGLVAWFGYRTTRSDTNGVGQVSPHDSVGPVLPGEMNRPARIAILGFQNLSASEGFEWMSTGLTTLLSEELQKSSRLGLLQLDDIAIAKGELGIIESGMPGQSQLARIRDRLDVDWVITGTFNVEQSNQNLVRLKVVAHNTAGQPTVIKCHNDLVLDRWPELCSLSGAQLRDKFRLPAPDIAATGNLFPATPNLKSAPDYFGGIAAISTFDYQQAVDLLSSAAETDSESALIQDRLAKALQLLGNESKARKHAAKAVEHLDSLPQPKRLAILAHHSLLQNQPAQAIEHYRKLIELHGKSIRNRLQLASALTRAGQGHEALELLDESRKEDHSRSIMAKIDLQSAQAAQSISRFEDQVGFAQAAEKTADKIGARLIQAQAARVMAEGLRRMGQFDDAWIRFEHARKIFADCRDPRNQVLTITYWAKALIDHGQFDLAIEKIDEGLSLANGQPGQHLVARLESLLGEIAVYQGNFELATERLQKCLTTYKNLGDWQGIASMNLILANVYARTGKTDLAFRMIDRARKAHQTSGNRLGEGKTWAQEGGMRARTGDTILAATLLERALELFREVGDKQSIAICLGDLATTHSKRGRLKRAAELYSESLELHRQLDSRRGPEIVMYSLGNLYKRTGRFSEARDLFRESFKRFESTGIWLNAVVVRHALADIQLQQGDLAAAQQTLADLLVKAREIKARSTEALVHYTLSDLAMFRGNFDFARQNIETARRISLELKRDLVVANCDYAAANMLLLQGGIENARNAEKKLAACAAKILSLNPEFKPIFLFTRSRAQAMSGETTMARNTYTAAVASLDNWSTEDVTMQIQMRHEQALAMAELDQQAKAEKQLANVTDRCRSIGWQSAEFQAALQRFQIRRRQNQSIEKSELNSFHDTMRQNGFLWFADQAAELLSQL